MRGEGTLRQTVSFTFPSCTVLLEGWSGLQQERLSRARFLPPAEERPGLTPW